MEHSRRIKLFWAYSFAGISGGLHHVNQKLSFKLILIAVSISMTSVIATSLLILSLHRQHLMEDYQESITHLSDVVEAGLEYAMLVNDWEVVNATVKNQTETHFLDHIQILDHRGIVRASSNPADIGLLLDYSSPACQFCHNNPENPHSNTGILPRKGGQDAFVSVNLITNRQQCHGCHDPQQDLLGLLVIEKPLTDLNAELLKAFWRIGTAGLFTFCLLLVLLLWTGKRIVLEPVRALNQGVTAIASGDLNEKIMVYSQDELGRLATAFDSMRQQLKSSQSAMKQRNQELALLNDIALNASQMLDLQGILDLALDTVVDRLGMQSGSIRLYDEEIGRFTLRAARGIPQVISEKIERRRLEAGVDLSQKAIDTGEVIFYPDMAAEPVFREIWGDTPGRSFVNIPLKSRGVAIGTLVLITYPGQPLRLENLEILTAVGHEVGIAIDNALLLQETRDREQEARHLYHLAAEVSGSLEIDQVLQVVARGAREFMSADLGLVGLLDEDREEIVIEAVDGIDGEALQGLRLPFHENWENTCLKSEHGMQLQELTEHHALYNARDLLADAGAVSLLTMPLCRGSKLQGGIFVAYRQSRYFRQKELQRMDRLAHQVYDAVENARLYQKVSYLATLEERERLAREMHDRLAQALGYLNLKAAITEGLLEENQIAQAQSSIQELKQISQATYTDVRESIFNLRTVLASGLRFLPTLEGYIRDYRIHYGLNIQMTLNGVDLSRFPPDIDIQLLRIIQEALTNVRKHAQASRVRILFNNEQDGVTVIVEDNGSGFDRGEAAAGQGSSFGLQIMRERAESVGGTLRIETNPGRGTRVVVWMPFENHERWSA